MANQNATAAVPIEVVRKNFFDNATLRSQQLVAKNYDSTKDTEIQITLPKAGFANFVLLTFAGTLAITGTGGTIVFSDKAPYNLFDAVKFDDYLGINRITQSGDELNDRLVTQRWKFDENDSTLQQAYSGTRYQMSLGGGNGAAGNYPMNFGVVVPIALHHNTTQGTFPFTIPNGDNVLTVDFLAALKGNTNEYLIKETVAGFTVTLTGKVQATYYYWDVKSNISLPVQDFALVHELRSVKKTDLTAGEEARYMLRTGRTYYAATQKLRLNDVPDTADVQNIVFYVDGDTSTLNESLQAYLTRVYMTYGRDFKPGLFFYDWFNKPWTPNSYGSLETSLEIAPGATVTGNSYLKVGMESLYRTSKIIQDLANLPGATA